MSAQEPSLTDRQVRRHFAYLEKKGFLQTQPGAHDTVTARIVPAGIDIAEGAVTDAGILPVRPEATGLRFKRHARRWVLAYCAQFPDVINADDEIHAEFTERGGVHLSLEQVRMAIWYLGGKGYVDMKTQPVSGDFVYLARITASGIDLVDGIAADPGVADEA